jgi:DnaJ family protein A protein 2
MKEVTIARNVLCEGCKGNGTNSGNKGQRCEECDGSGIQVMLRGLGGGMYQQVRVECGHCNGLGEMISEKDRCNVCEGKKLKNEKKTLKAHIDKGCPNGRQLKFIGEADQEPGYETGDVVLIVREAEHDTFRRDGDDLIMKKNISLIDALTGFSFVIKHLDGREIIINSDAGDIIKNDDLREVENLGMPCFARTYLFGSLFIQFNIVFPESLTSEQIETLKQCFTPTPLPIAEENAPELTAVVIDQEKLRRRRMERERAEAEAYEEEHGHEHGEGITCRQQ